MTNFTDKIKNLFNKSESEIIEKIEEKKAEICDCHCSIHNQKCRYGKFRILRILLLLIVFLIVFQTGIFVGYHKAMFYRSSGMNYYKSFKMRGSEIDPFSKQGERSNGQAPEQYGFNGLDNGALPGGNGAVGKIVSINLPTIVISSPDNTEKTIKISDDTVIRKFRETVSSKDLKVGQFIISFGDINDSDKGVISAKLVRLLPPPPTADNTQNSQAPNTQAPTAPKQ